MLYLYPLLPLPSASREAIHKMHNANDEDEALLCLTLLETVIAYRYLPIQVLSISLIGLCRIVNVPHLTGRVVKVSSMLKYNNVTGLQVINCSAEV